MKSIMTSSSVLGLLLLFGAGGSNLYASDNLNFTLTVSRASCTMSVPASVGLGQYRNTSFKGIGTTSSMVTFNLSLTNCVSTNFITVSVAGEADAGDGSYYKVSSSGGETAATGVALRLRGGVAKVIQSPGGSVQFDSIPSGDSIINYYADYIQTQDSVTAGSADATVVFTVSYS